MIKTSLFKQYEKTFRLFLSFLAVHALVAVRFNGECPLSGSFDVELSADGANPALSARIICCSRQQNSLAIFLPALRTVGPNRSAVSIEIVVWAEGLHLL